MIYDKDNQLAGDILSNCQILNNRRKHLERATVHKIKDQDNVAIAVKDLSRRGQK